jgi:tRNA (cytidine/uridine-2'-O-)-methyltransferase
MLNVVLVNPEIPPNTGNVGRLCCAVGARLHLIKPLGFSLHDRYLRRAGLDYWKNVDLVTWKSLDEYLESTGESSIVLTSSKRGNLYHELEFRQNDHILFGPETKGLSLELLNKYPNRIARIPIYLDAVRSLNLSTSAGIVVYEALKQTNSLPNVRLLQSPDSDIREANGFK